ncbi:hypothetical protein LOD99_4329 [Oopsacas minuta]|uniref:Aldehyde dehydrogenase domain-containing protein n=1 Tax=Oopsacas minuta TaxID=111878 RepID=A0AAV7JUC9_9METZ|nr:hypothetical protein LOD99_4329 [Oopsacas minuta]
MTDVFNIEDYYSTDQQIQENYERLRKSVKSQRAHPLSYRKEQLGQLSKIMENEKEVICEALKMDLNKGYSESVLFEICAIENELRLFASRLEEWNKPEYVSKSFLYAMDDVHIKRDPYGMVLIIGAWNYPIQLVLLPLAGAIAGGNCAILKPSEIAPHCAKVVTDLVTKYMDPECYAVLNGAAKETQKMLEYRWEHIFYTGSNRIAKIISKAACDHLTPVTLELGGKNPTYVHSDVDLDVTAKRIAWGKFMNVGQTCLAPDYVLCHSSVVEPFTEAMIRTVKKFYTDNPQTFSDYGRIINKMQLNRITKMLDNTKGEIVLGGERDIDERYLAPTIVKNVKTDDSLFDGEIFGPVLPILQVDSYEHALDVINEAEERSLSIYVFCKDKKIVEIFRDRTTSGSFVSNDSVVQAGCLSLPFGGVGHSGTGSYHGKYSFENFTHQKAVLLKSQGGEAINSMRYPPITRKTADRLYSLVMHREGLGKAFSLVKTAVFFAAFTILVVVIDRIVLLSLMEDYLIYDVIHPLVLEESMIDSRWKMEKVPDEDIEIIENEYPYSDDLDNQWYNGANVEDKIWNDRVLVYTYNFLKLL